MSPRGYAIAMCVLLCLSAAALWGALPARHELGGLDTMSCDTWFASRTFSGPVRLTGCVVDARDPSLLSIDRDHGIVGVRGIRDPGDAIRIAIRPRGYRGDPHAYAPSLAWRTDDPRLRALATRMQRLDYDAQERFVERHLDELLYSSDVTVGRIDPSREGFVADSRIPPRRHRLLAAVILPFPLGGLLALIFAQRAWRRRLRAPSHGDTGPLRF
jgi:hypothetical protein